jgi:hypothetical protein
VVLQSVGVLASGWHRPSDALAGIAVAVSWMAAAVWVIARSGRVVADDCELIPVRAERRLVVGVLVVLLAALLFSAEFGGETTLSLGGLAYLTSSAAIIVAGVGAVWWFWYLLRDWTLDVPPSAQPDDAQRSSS